MTIIDTHVFRCEIYGQYINVKKTNRPVLYGLGIAEIIVNAEPTSKYNSMCVLVMLLSRHSIGVVWVSILI